jgi:parvulin-like peptidyl-prolyl isomerase
VPVARKRLIALVLVVALVVALVIAATSSGLGDPSVPDGDIAVVSDVDNGTITPEEFQLVLKQQATQAAQQQTQPGQPAPDVKVPKPGDPTYDQLKDAAVGDLLLSRWVTGEAAEQGIEVSDREVDTQLDTIAKQQFGGRKQFDAFIKSSGFCTDEELTSKPLNCQAARDRVKLQAITSDLQKQALDAVPKPTDDEIQQYYDANIDQFKTPETRDVRQVVNKDAAKVQAAKVALEKDSSDKSWTKVAKKYSSDAATSTAGGLRQALVPGASGDQDFDDQVFGAEPKTLIGPFKGAAGFYLVEVEKITPASTTALADVKDQIKSTLAQSAQQLAETNFETDFLSKWRARSFCADDYVMDRCANYAAPPAQCSYQVANPDDCGDAPVVSTRPVAPGTAGVIGAGAPAVGLPQGPHGVAPPIDPSAAALQGLPQGAVPGATGTVPPTGAAPAGAPPTGAAPTGAAPATP